jgi:hypothetical protein
MILVSAIEVGSVRSLFPVCLELISERCDIVVDRKGFFKEKECSELDLFYINLPYDNLSIKEFLIRRDIKVLLFSVNVHDTFPLKIARIAQSIDIKTVHILDYWNGYSSRMKLDGKGFFKPTKYLVPDEYAKNEAIADGIDGHIIIVTGQPALSDSAQVFSRIGVGRIDNLPLKNKNKKLILFVSEPVALDQGNSLQDNKNYRGYVEKDALKILLKALKNTVSEFSVIVLPHPRQDILELEQIWQSLGGEQYGDVVSGFRGRDLLPLVSGVSGMSSTLLYEAWLVGVPVLSIQPGLLNDSLRMMQKKKDVIFIDKYEVSSYIAEKWLNSLNDKVKVTPKPDLNLHIGSPEVISKEVRLLDL